MTDLVLFATAPRHLETLLADELTALGAANAAPTRAGVAFEGDLAAAYRACLWSRLASRVLLRLAEVPAADADMLHGELLALPWEDHLSSRHTFAVDFVGTSATIRDSRFGARRVKDAVMDRLRGIGGGRPRVDLEQPDIRLNVRLQRERATVSLDLSGESLHRRGYRPAGRRAPLKENLAAAVLQRARWPAMAAEGATLLDPLCGSGTLLIEAALIAGDVAPGLLRPRFGFERWPGHDHDLWSDIRAEAEARRQAGLGRLPPLLGFDADDKAVTTARRNAIRAGLGERIRIEPRALASQPQRPPAERGLLVTNPPYGHRLEAGRPVEQLYMDLGDWTRRALPGWRIAVLTAGGSLLSALGLRAERTYALYNGALPCRLGVYEIALDATPAPRSAVAEAPPALVNRLRKNARHLARWARREGVECYRVYDADLPEYAMAVDLYRGERLYAHVQEYAPPAEISPRKAQHRRGAALAAVGEVFDLPAKAVFFKIRRPRRAAEQYGRQGQTGTFHQVGEPGCRLLVNFTNYLDTGLFLDHRPLRLRLQREAAGRRFLNLFCYTATATVHAAVGGASATVSVDLSHTYLDWARRNLRLNELAEDRHTLIHADCRAWLADAARRRQRFDLILLDPPTVSRSRRMEGSLDVQRDHPELIGAAAALLAPGGVLYFSTNYRRFRLHEEALNGLEVAEITKETIGPDFARSPRIHRCWRIQASGNRPDTIR